MAIRRKKTSEVSNEPRHGHSAVEIEITPRNDVFEILAAHAETQILEAQSPDDTATTQFAELAPGIDKSESTAAVSALNAEGKGKSILGGMVSSVRDRFGLNDRPTDPRLLPRTGGELSSLDAQNISAWFGNHKVLDRVSLSMPAGQVTALIGPSGCGKSTFLRVLNRMHELVPIASVAGEVYLDGQDIYDPELKLTQARRDIGMVFQKPNPFPAMSIYDNVLAGLTLTGLQASKDQKDEIVERSLRSAGLWTEVRDRLRAPGGGLSGGQQQRLCIARSLSVMPKILLMDEPCSALDPTSTRVIEDTMLELVQDVTIVIVTHNMQQAQRVSQQCAFFLAAHGEPGYIVEHGDTEAMFAEPQDERTFDYVNGRFG